MSIELQPTLRSDRLELRPLRDSDFDELYAVAADPLIWAQHPDRDRHREEVFQRFFSDALDSGGALVAIDLADNRIIGSSRYHGYNEQEHSIEIGWTFLARSRWGGDYNGEMKRLMLEHAFRTVDKVLFLIGPDNLRSQRAVEKIGATRAGSRPDGAGRISFVYEIGK